MNENIENAIKVIEDDYRICFRIIGKYFDYLETLDLKEFNKFSKYKWSYDRDKSNGYSYVCIRYGSSLERKILVKKRAYIKDEDLYKWVDNKKFVEEALDEAHKYIVDRVTSVMLSIEEMKEIAVGYNEKLKDISEDYEKAMAFKKKPAAGKA